MVSDQDLWLAVKNGEEQAFTSLFYRYSSRIYSNSYGYVRDSEACKEIVHDIFISLWTNRSTLVISNFNAYVTSAARYRVYKLMTQRKNAVLDYKENLDELEVADSLTSTNEGYDNLNKSDFEQQVNKILEELPGRCREIFLMSRFQHLSNEEIALKLGISKRTVENQITHALKYLRFSLKGLSVLLVIFESFHK